MDFFVIGDDTMVLGFGLLGIPGKVVTTSQDVLTTLKEAIEQNIKIILFSERLSVPIKNELENMILKLDFPLVIEIPDRQGPVEGRKSIHDLLKSSIGFSL